MWCSQGDQGLKSLLDAHPPGQGSPHSVLGVARGQPGVGALLRAVGFARGDCGRTGGGGS